MCGLTFLRHFARRPEVRESVFDEMEIRPRDSGQNRQCHVLRLVIISGTGTLPAVVYLASDLLFFEGCHCV